MGMFDWINYIAPCPICGQELKYWQSKDEGCQLKTLEPYEVKHFYAWCKPCGKMIAAEVDAEVEKTVVVKKLIIKLSVERDDE